MSYTPFYSQWKDWPDVSTPVTAAAMQHIEAGIVAAGGGNAISDITSTGGSIAVTTPLGPTTNVDVATSGVTAATYGDSTHVPQIAVGADGRITSASNVTITGGGGGGTELDYVELTSNVTVSSTADGASGGTAIIDGNAVSYDGSTRIMVEFGFAVTVPNGAELVVNLYDGTTDLGRMAFFSNQGSTSADSTLYARRFLTPSNASHTYHIRGWRVTSNCTVLAGAGGSATRMPAWYRITKA